MLQQRPVKMELVILWETTMPHLNPNVCLSIVMDRSGIVFITHMKHYMEMIRENCVPKSGISMFRCLFLCALLIKEGNMDMATKWVQAD